MTYLAVSLTKNESEEFQNILKKIDGLANSDPGKTLLKLNADDYN